jgi:hypothetical protein
MSQEPIYNQNDLTNAVELGVIKTILNNIDTKTDAIQRDVAVIKTQQADIDNRVTQLEAKTRFYGYVFVALFLLVITVLGLKIEWLEKVKQVFFSV